MALAKGRANYDRIRRKKELSPRLKLAARIYATGQQPTKAAAARAAGLKPGTFYIQSSQAVADPQMQKILQDTDRMVQDATLSTRKMIDILARESIGTLGSLMRTSADETVKLRAAIDLADRGSETSKIQRLQVDTGLTLSREDARSIADLLVESAELKQKYAHLETENFVTLEGGFSAENAESANPEDNEGRSWRERDEAAGREEREVKLLGKGDGNG